MIPIGIDLISFYSTRYVLPLETLAAERNVDVNKYHHGLGQEVMAVPPPDEDVVTMAASAARPLMDLVDKNDIELVLFATETGVDQSKSAGLFVHGLLDLPHRCRAVELKQACYSATMALRMAMLMLAAKPDKKALVLASDIARYDLGSPAEPTQGCGAVAMLVSAHPRLLALDAEAGLHAEDVMDFWRPNYREEALVDGKYSTRMYTRAAMHAWDHYAEQTGRTLSDFDRCCYHIPFTRMAYKAHIKLVQHITGSAPDAAAVEADVGGSLHYNRQTGNSYTAALYEGLTCLLDTDTENLADKRIGLFSYGSGCMGEFFSGVIQPDYRKHLFAERHQSLLDDRTVLSYRAYEDILNLRIPEDGLRYDFAPYRNGGYRFAGVRGHKRCYETVT